jgi:hypothetical protein
MESPWDVGTALHEISETKQCYARFRGEVSKGDGYQGPNDRQGMEEVRGGEVEVFCKWVGNKSTSSELG